MEDTRTMSMLMMMTLLAVLTPAQGQIESARARIDSGIAPADGYTALAVGLTRRARETGDAAYYDQAILALDQASGLEPAHREAIMTRAWVLMGRHEFAKALASTERYQRLHGDDPVNLGVMGDALMELGRYEQAEAAYQKMLDMRPGPASYSRAAYARELRGDVVGALEMMRAALSATSLQEREDRAWLHCQVGHLLELSDDLPGAQDSYRAALASFQGYHYALAALAETALRLGRAGEAASMAQASIDAAPHAERYLLLADAQRAQGRSELARASEATFESLASRNIMRPDNENHDLVLFYLERRNEPRRALAIARHEARVRQDIHTLDRLAIALDAAGRTRSARRVIARAVETGTADPVILRHAERILGR